MFSGLFNYDNPIWRFIGKFWDVLMVHILWLICSIPIFTIGASTTAMYYVTLKLVRDEDGYTFRSFFKSFKENFKQATIIWLIFLVVGIVLGVDLWFFTYGAGSLMGEKMRFGMNAVFVALLVVWGMILLYVFPVLSRFYNTVKQTLLTSFVMSVRHILWTITMLVMDAAIVFLTLTFLPMLMMFGVALMAYANSFVFHQIFKKYIPEERDVHEMRPLFSEEAAGKTPAQADEKSSETQDDGQN